jgi:hypothetical protein
LVWGEVDGTVKLVTKIKGSEPVEDGRKGDTWADVA